MTASLFNLSVSEILGLFQAKKLSPVDVANACLKQALKYNPAMNALCFMEESAFMRGAKASEKRWMKGDPRGSLDGIPVTIKDWFDVKGWPTRYGSLLSSDMPQPADSPSVARLREEGALFMAKTTLPEYGHKGATHSPLTGVTRNPWNIEKTPGGSSGGAAAAAATGMGFLHLGSDAGGSLRIPASFSGVVGFKPSPGRVPSWPPSLFSTLSSVGPLCRSVADAAMMMDIISKPDARDWHALPLPAPKYAEALKTALPKIKIAYAATINDISPMPDVAGVLEEKKKALSALGNVDEIKLDCPQLITTFNRHWMAVAAHMTQGIPARDRKKMDPRFISWIERGQHLSLNDYLAAEKERMMIGAYFKSILDSYDILITPTTAMSAFAAGIDMPDGADGKPWEDWTPFTYPANLARLPAISIPLGTTPAGLPVGIQIMAGYLKDELVLQAAKKLETVLDFKNWLSRQAFA